MVTRTTHTRLDDLQLAMLHAMLDEQRQFRIEQLMAAEPAPASTAADLEIQQTILRGARLALTEIEAALDRMARGTYGRCVHCGTRLPLERLEVLPQAAQCMPCQQREDALR